MTDTKKRNLDLELISSFAQFSLLYPFAHPVNQHMGHFISSLARQMMVNFDNQLALEFPKRIIRYVRFKFGLAKYQAEGFVKSCFTNNLVLNKEQTEFRNWVKFYPLDPIQIPFNDHHFLKLSLEILEYLDSVDEGTKGRKLFTLAPLKGDYVDVNITINSTTLLDLFALWTPEKRYELLCWVEVDDVELNELIVKAMFNKNKTITREMLSQPEFSKECFRILFNTKQYERANVQFAHSIKTNGYTACLLMEIAKKEESKHSRKTYDHLIAIDPGIGNLVTACNEQDETVGISGKEYRHRAKFNQQKQWENGMRKRETEYQTIIQNMPSMKTSDFEKLRLAIGYRLEHFTFLFDFCKTKPFLKWRFTTYVYSQKALTWIAKKVVGNKKNAAIGFGDWSQTDGFVRGHPKAPPKRIKKALGVYATVIEVDEYRTSQVCSKCKVGKCDKDDHKLEKMKYGAVPCHFVLRCLSCNTIWQRDVNASRNIMEAFKAQMNGLSRPSYLERGKLSNPSDNVGYTAPKTKNNAQNELS